MPDAADPVITLPARCDLDAVAELHADLVSGLATGSVVIDGAQVTRIDAAVLQLLCAAVQAVRRGGGSLTWCAAPAPLLGAAIALGLIDALGLSPTSEV